MGGGYRGGRKRWEMRKRGEKERWEEEKGWKEKKDGREGGRNHGMDTGVLVLRLVKHSLPAFAMIHCG